MGNEVGLTLFGATTNGGQFSDPRDTKALYRYLSGTNSAATGDDECNVGDVKVTKICFVNQGSSADMRFFQASGGADFSLGTGRILLDRRGLHLLGPGQVGRLHRSRGLQLGPAPDPDRRR